MKRSEGAVGIDKDLVKLSLLAVGLLDYNTRYMRYVWATLNLRTLTESTTKLPIEDP